MPLIFILRSVLSLLSVAILAGGGYLLWTWSDGQMLRGADGLYYRVRDDWRLWAAAALLAWSFFGRTLALLLLAGPDKGEPSRPQRGEGRRIASPTGAELYVETHGPSDAPTIILTHGWGLDSTIWRSAIRALSDHYRLIVWDLPGLGRSTRPKGADVSLSGFAVDLAAVIEASGTGRVFLVGHSIGGMTIQTLVENHLGLVEQRVAGIALFNTTYTNPLRTMVFAGLAQALRRPVIEPLMRLTIWLQPLAWLSAWQSYLSGSAHIANRLGFGRSVTRSQLDHTTLLATRNPPGAAARGNLAMFRWDATGAISRARCPIVVVGGDVDIVTKLEASKSIADHTAHGRLVVVEGVNHMGFLERAERYHKAIVELVEADNAMSATKIA